MTASPLSHRDGVLLGEVSRAPRPGSGLGGGTAVLALTLLERLEDDTPPARPEDAAWMHPWWRVRVAGVVSPLPVRPTDPETNPPCSGSRRR